MQGRKLDVVTPVLCPSYPALLQISEWVACTAQHSNLHRRELYPRKKSRVRIHHRWGCQWRYREQSQDHPVSVARRHLLHHLRSPWMVPPSSIAEFSATVFGTWPNCPAQARRETEGATSYAVEPTSAVKQRGVGPGNGCVRCLRATFFGISKYLLANIKLCRATCTRAGL